MLHVRPIPAFTDNYVWMLSRGGGRDAVLVDPGDGPAVVSALHQHKLRPLAVLLTHRHADHVAGLDDVVALAPAMVFGPAHAALAGVDRHVAHGDRITFETLDLELDVLEVPGHTLDHLAYVGPDFVLAGDTLFAGGCGRVFEGTMEQMYGSLQRLAALPPTTRLFCGHEYTIANLEFARRVETSNAAITRRLEAARQLRSRDRPTLPSTLADELATNPFLRCEQPAVVAAAAAHAGRPVQPGAEAFGVIRRWKDSG